MTPLPAIQMLPKPGEGKGDENLKKPMETLGEDEIPWENSGQLATLLQVLGISSR